MLERQHRFLTTRERAELETAADRFFQALGYRRRADEGSLLVFERGRSLARFYSASLRKYPSRLEVAVDRKPGEETAVASVRHRVRAFPSFTFKHDATYLDVESRAFQRFLEKGDLDVAGVVAAAQSRATAYDWALSLLVLAGFVGVVALAGAVAPMIARALKP